MYIDLEGKEIKRTPECHPYDYDSFVLWKGEYHKEFSHVAHSDRLYEWDSKKFDSCCKKVFGNTGQLFNKRSPKKINKFLNMYLGKEVVLTAILQCCNQSTGFPYWCFLYEDSDNSMSFKNKHLTYNEWKAALIFYFKIAGLSENDAISKSNHFRAFWINPEQFKDPRKVVLSSISRYENQKLDCYKTNKSEKRSLEKEIMSARYVQT